MALKSDIIYDISLILTALRRFIAMRLIAHNRIVDSRVLAPVVAVQKQ